MQCEDTCSHVHGIDLSHYQGNVFWETVGDNSKMAYVYLKATEGGTNVDSKYKQNIDRLIDMDSRWVHTTFTVPVFRRRPSWRISWLNADRATRISCL